jgi:hypothetical protein
MTHRFLSLDRPSSQTVLYEVSLRFILYIKERHTHVIESKHCGHGHHGEGTYVYGAKIVK